MSNKNQTTNYLTISEALHRAEQQKIHYEKNLINKNILYVYMSNNEIIYNSVFFKKSSYLHLTGLDYKNKQSAKRQGKQVNYLGAEEFYRRLGIDKTLINDVSFVVGSDSAETNRFFYYTQHKLANLPQLTSIAKKAEYIGKYKGQQDFDIIVNKANCSIAFKAEKNVNDFYSPTSSLNGTAQSLATDIKPILAIFVKDLSDRVYKLEYINKNVNIGRKSFSTELTDLLTYKSFEKGTHLFNNEKYEALKLTFDISVTQKFKKRRSELSSLREKALNSNDTEALDEYYSKLKDIVAKLNCPEKCDKLIEILETENSNPYYIADIESEIKAVQDRKRVLAAMEASGDNGSISIMSMTDLSVSRDGTVSAPKAIDITLPSAKNIVKNIKKGLKKIISGLFNPSKNTDIELTTKINEQKPYSEAQQGKKQMNEPQPPHTSSKRSYKGFMTPTKSRTDGSSSKELKQEHSKPPKNNNNHSL